nr:hypothetical protein [Tanacetum cinerariifolium]
MTSFGYRLNPRFAIKECSSCGTLYTRDCYCSKGNVEDKILVPKPPKNWARCARFGHPVDGPYCQGCTLLREKLEEDLVTYFQNFQNTFDDDSTNVVNTPRKPLVVKQDHGSFVDKIICDLNKAPDSPHLHTFSPNQFHCFHCKDVLGDGETCQRCTCKRCGSGHCKGLCYICENNQNSLNDSLSISANSSHNPPQIDECAHIGYNCLPKVPIISNPEPCNQTMNNELPQTLPSFDTMCYSDKENSVPCVSKPNFVDESFNIFNPPLQPHIYYCEFCGSNAQYGHYCTPQAPFINPEPGYSQDFNFLQNIEEEQAASARYWKIPACCDDDDDYNFVITPVLSTEEPDNSLSMGDEHLDNIPATKSDEVIKSGVKDLVPIPSESKGIPDTIDNDSLYKENIEYVEASPHNSELVCLEVAEIVIQEVKEIKDDNLREKLLNVHF